jgi:hypothetical protein
VNCGVTPKPGSDSDSDSDGVGVGVPKKFLRSRSRNRNENFFGVKIGVRVIEKIFSEYISELN